MPGACGQCWPPLGAQHTDPGAHGVRRGDPSLEGP